MTLVADQKFSTFENGGNLELGDTVVGLRGGINTKFNYAGTGVNSIIGTALQVIASNPTGNVTLSLPQDIAPTSSPHFLGVHLTNPLEVSSGGIGINTVPSNGQIPIGNGATYTAATLTAGTGISITNGAGSIQISSSGVVVTPAALTKTDDTNVTLTLGGTPATSLLQPTSLTLGWTGSLSSARGGTGLPGTGLITAPAASQSSALSIGAAFQNLLGYDVVLTVYLAIASATTGNILLGVGPTTTPTQQTIVSGLTLAALNVIPVTIYLPNNYYALLSTSGTITVTISGQQAMPV